MESTIACPPALEPHKAEALRPTEVTDRERDAAPPGLKYIPKERVDPRTDGEIAEWLQHQHPVVSQKNVWYFWHTGWHSMKPWVQRGIISSVRRLGSEWTVHFLDNVQGSETHVSKYIDTKKYLPKAFLEGTMDGYTVGQFQGDLVRLPLLLEYGGIWMDAGMILFRHLDDLCWKKIEDEQSPYELAGFLITCRPPDDVAMANGFIATKAHNPFLQRVWDVYRKLWDDGATNSNGFHSHPLLNHLGLLGPSKDVPVKVDDYRPVTDYLAQTWSIERIRHLVDPNDGFDGPKWWAEHVLAFNMPMEMWRHQITTHWNGKRQFELFSKKRSGKDCVKDADWHEAEALVHEIISDSALMKLSAGAPGTADWWLASYWNMEENSAADIEEDTFAAYLRWASCHFDQTREIVPLKLEVETEGILHAGYLEPNKDSQAVG